MSSSCKVGPYPRSSVFICGHFFFSWGDRAMAVKLSFFKRSASSNPAIGFVLQNEGRPPANLQIGFVLQNEGRPPANLQIGFVPQNQGRPPTNPANWLRSAQRVPAASAALGGYALDYNAGAVRIAISREIATAPHQPDDPLKLPHNPLLP